MKSAVEKMKDSQEGLKARLNKLKERCFKTVGKEENLEVVGSTARGVLVLKSVLRSLTEEEQEIEAQVDERMASLQVTAPRDSSGLLGTADEEKPKENKEPDGGTFNVESSNDSLTRPDPVVPDTGRSEEVMTTGISVTVEAEPGSEEDQLSAHDLSLPESADLENLVDRKLTEFINLGITEEDFKAMDETRKIEIEIGDMLMSLQKSFAQGLMHHATKIHVEVSVMLAELFLLLSTNVKEKLFKFQAFRSCLKDIEEDKSDAKVVKWILEVLKVADEELKKMKTSTRQGQKCRSSETDGDKKLPETGELLEELIDQFIILIAELDSLMNYMGHLESRVLDDKAIQSFESGLKNMERKVQGIESNMEVLRSRCSYRDFSPVLVGIANVHCGLGLPKK
ncbi:hypothetical protein CDL15_Pgr000063 [Punica granatum]|uniref:Uncharacterized protein n=1 Tax=Punica granatum TaxID=22663 RepID=A0A218VQD9_PUNGR|nr:hypothetical protein CDL15_Pgr000063 [Punica granatum]